MSGAPWNRGAGRTGVVMVVALAAGAVGLAVGPAAGQDDAAPPAAPDRAIEIDPDTPAMPPPPSDEKGFAVTVRPGFEYQLESSFGAGGDYDVLRLQLDVGARTMLAPRLELSIDGWYELGNYGFSDQTPLGVDPWDTVNRAGVAARFKYDFDGGWSLFGGPILELGWESGASIDDGILFGGFGGVGVRLSDSLYIGVGAGAISQLEDGAKTFPVVLMRWEITNSLRLVSRTGRATGRLLGGELVYDLARHWELGFGVSYDWRRFRLDTDGVGQETGVPIVGRLSYVKDAGFRFTGFLGLMAGPNLSLREPDGTKLDAGSTSELMLGVRVGLRF